MSIAIPESITDVSADLVDQVAAFVKADIDLQAGRIQAEPSDYWASLRATGSELWLDTGDLEAASQRWTSDFTALTTNNTLLNKEIQKGIYDQLISESTSVLGGLSAARKILEIGFILNARHGLRLAQRFGGKVSVELSTELADDVDGSVFYGRRYHAICPEHFIVKIPLTAAGLLAAKILREEGVLINFTLGFSARQNHVIASFTQPAYVNVFLGRGNAYIKNNALGDGDGVGEKALLASQRTVRELNEGRDNITKQIAASLRSGEQVAAIAGVDVYTMPTGVADDAIADQLRFSDQTATDPAVNLAATAEAGRVNCLWDIDESVELLCASLQENEPESAEDIIERAEACGAEDLFPVLSQAEKETIIQDGKIPVHAHWTEHISAGRVAPDTLLRLAGLATFSQDQAALDDRIRGLIS